MGVKWTGLDALQHDLHTLPADLTADADPILNAAGETAQTAIAAAYPFQSGALRRGLVLTPAAERFVAGATLRQTAPHGWIFEHGTKDRANQAGSNRGRMPPQPTFIPIAAAERRTALAAVVDRLYDHGATRVTGEIA